MPLILGATAGTAAAQKNSCRFNPDDDPTLTRSSIGTPTDVNKWTFSAWVKRGRLDSDNFMMRLYADNSNYTTFGVAGTAVEYDNKVSGSFDGRRLTSAVYRDPAAWYHYVAVYDSDNVTGDDRMIIYVNGERITALGSDSDPGSGSASGLGSGNTITVGIGGATGTGEWGGYMAEVALCDGQAYAASDFGEFDSDSPTIWKPKDISGLTFGNEGFYLDFADSADLGNDVSGNGNDFTVANLAAIDQCTDSPTNNFCTMNPLQNYYFQGTYSEGNCKVVTSEKAWNSTTLGVTAGKWYWETNLVARTGGVDYNVGFSGNSPEDTADDGGSTNGGYTYYYRVSNGSIWNEGSTSLTVSTADTGDIIGIALDLDNMAWYASKNGVWQNSGVPTSGGSKTGACGTPMAVASTLNGVYMPLVTYLDASTTGTFSLNYGNPPYALTSAEADGNGYGQFEYAPPSGYLAICTKNLGSDGG